MCPRVFVYEGRIGFWLVFRVWWIKLNFKIGAVSEFGYSRLPITYTTANVYPPILYTLKFAPTIIKYLNLLPNTVYSSIRYTAQLVPTGYRLSGVDCIKIEVCLHVKNLGFEVLKCIYSSILVWSSKIFVTQKFWTWLLKIYLYAKLWSWILKIYAKIPHLKFKTIRKNSGF